MKYLMHERAISDASIYKVTVAGIVYMLIMSSLTRSIQACSADDAVQCIQEGRSIDVHVRIPVLHCSALFQCLIPVASAGAPNLHFREPINLHACHGLHRNQTAGNRFTTSITAASQLELVDHEFKRSSR
jgi:hypothetical protein